MSTLKTCRGVAVAAIVASAVVAGCGGGEKGSAVPPNPDLTVEALDIRFDKTEYSAKSGEVKVAYISRGQQTHTLLFQQGGRTIGTKLRVAPGKSAGGTYSLTAGKYDMVCDIPGHKEAGMTATLTVS